jgi:PKD repeat protein
MKIRLFSIIFLLTGHFCVTGQQDHTPAGYGDCLAHYSPTHDSINLSLVFFHDESTGNLDSWFWDFGDPQSGSNNTSKLQNPLHQFTSSGVFNICLTITNADTGHPCNNTFCDTVVIDLNYNCHANFSVIPDSTDASGKNFKFFDHSTGNPNHFLWNFGDGSSSDLKNPEHLYATSGDYHVCLTMIRSDSSDTLCMDTICRQVNVINYYKLGGHAFAGLFPINNPVSTGDTGIAYLYRLSNSAAALQDTNEFVHLGYFTFPRTAQGRYIVKVALTPASTHYQNYLPTYYPDALLEENALPIEINDTSIFNADIYLHPLNPGISETYFSGSRIIIGDPYPDPVSDVIYLKIRSSYNCILDIDLVSIFGNKVASYVYHVIQGENTLKIPAVTIPAGMYLIKSGFQDGSIIFVRKFLKP